jgi:hypothetical protein
MLSEIGAQVLWSKSNVSAPALNINLVLVDELLELGEIDRAPRPRVEIVSWRLEPTTLPRRRSDPAQDRERELHAAILCSKYPSS